ncbi:DNA recombinase, partial [Escherichia coli]|nr:DNA recombinase [Escherichia coli]
MQAQTHFWRSSMSNIVEFVKQQEQLFCGALTEQ